MKFLPKFWFRAIHATCLGGQHGVLCTPCYRSKSLKFFYPRAVVWISKELGAISLGITRIGIGIGIGLWATSPAVAIVIRHDRADSLYRDLAQQPQFQAVGRLGGTNGILIAPDWVLTAAHVNGSSFGLGSRSYPVSRTIVHPNWNGDLALGYDLRLLQLATPVLDVAPTPIYGGEQELGLPAVFVGQGATGNGLSGNTQPGGTYRAAQNTLDRFGTYSGTPNIINLSSTSGRILLSDFDQPLEPSQNFFTEPGSSTPLDLEGMLAAGDSGGGAFIQIGQTWMLAGIHSFIIDTGGDGMASNYGDVMGIMRVSAHQDWIFAETGISAFQPNQAVNEAKLGWILTISIWIRLITQPRITHVRQANSRFPRIRKPGPLS